MTALPWCIIVLRVSCKVVSTAHVFGRDALGAWGCDSAVYVLPLQSKSGLSVEDRERKEEEKGREM
jgi:hypothetical protein